MRSSLPTLLMLPAIPNPGLLTGAEVSKLQLNEYDARRILVPNGWNWDGALFNLN